MAFVVDRLNEDQKARLKAVRLATSTPGGFPAFEQLPPRAALRMAYNVVLDREPDITGATTFLPAMDTGVFTYAELIDVLRGSDEYNTATTFRSLGPSLHTSQCRFVSPCPVLRPGGHLALDTPNARATRLQQSEFVDPDHKIEYDEPTLTNKIRNAGLEVVSILGLNHLGDCFETGAFCSVEVASHEGVYWSAADCYLLAYVCRKPAPAGTPTEELT